MMDKTRLVVAFFIVMLLGMTSSMFLSIAKIDLGTWLGLLALAVYCVAGYFIAPWVIKKIFNGQ